MLQHAVEDLETNRAVELILRVLLLLLKDVETLVVSEFCESVLVIWEEVMEPRVLCCNYLR